MLRSSPVLPAASSPSLAKAAASCERPCEFSRLARLLSPRSSRSGAPAGLVAATASVSRRTPASGSASRSLRMVPSVISACCSTSDAPTCRAISTARSASAMCSSVGFFSIPAAAPSANTSACTADGFRPSTSRWAWASSASSPDRFRWPSIRERYIRNQAARAGLRTSSTSFSARFARLSPRSRSPLRRAATTASASTSTSRSRSQDASSWVPGTQPQGG